MPKGSKLISTGSERIEMRCNFCDYIAKGEIGIRLHYKLTHGKKLEREMDADLTCAKCDERFGKNEGKYKAHLKKSGHYQNM